LLVARVVPAMLGQPVGEPGLPGGRELEVVGLAQVREQQLIPVEAQIAALGRRFECRPQHVWRDAMCTGDP
jgi:hypothetical protein